METVVVPTMASIEVGQASDEFGDIDVQCHRQPAKVQQRDVPDPALDAAHVSTVKAGPFGEPLLRQRALKTRGTYTPTEFNQLGAPALHP